jgi:hypothetical protein
VAGSTGYNYSLLTVGINNDGGSNPAQADRVSLFPSGGQGFVGVNTKTPQFSLDISGNLRASGNTTFNSGIFINETVGTRIPTTSATTGTITLTHSDASGASSIFFKSTNNSPSDYAYIQYEENVGGTSERGLLTIGCENDDSSDNQADRISLFCSRGRGFVGINTKEPGYHLDVSGSINATGLIQGQRFNSTSDYRVKSDIKDLDASYTVDTLRPVTYKFVSNGLPDIGFIAHEVQEHYPFLVQGEKDGSVTQSLNYTGIIGILTKELKELKAVVRELKDTLSEQSSKLSEQSSKLSEQSSKLSEQSSKLSEQDALIQSLLIKNS